MQLHNNSRTALTALSNSVVPDTERVGGSWAGLLDCARSNQLWLAVAFALLLLCAATTPASAVEPERASVTAPESVRQYRLSNVVINRRDIFDTTQKEQLPLARVYRLIDALHVTTREKTILREIDLAPGQLIYESDVEALERRLRALDLFASVTVELRPQTDTDAELAIQTRDRLSVVFGASGSFLGGVGEVGFTVGERNVAGTGDRLLLSYSGNTDGQLRGAIGYDDIHFVDNRHTASYSVGRTEEGGFYQMKFARPFKHRASRLSWSAKVESVEDEIDYYENGESVAQVPRQKDSLILEGYRRHVADRTFAPGFRRYFRYGAVLRFDNNRFESTRGEQPSLVTAPLDNNRVFAGALLAINRNQRFEKARGVDAVRFTEDLTFGYQAELLAGLDRTAERAGTRVDDQALEASDATEPALFLEASYAFGSAVSDAKTFGKLSFDGFSNLQSGDDRSWNAGLTLKLFNQSIKGHTLAGRISYITSDRGSDLPTQYTLGENNGLRGYATRQFSGSSRLRINLEDRIYSGWQVGALDVGLLTFIDAGWAGDDNSDLTLRSAAGVGLRLGSNALLGGDIIRLDVAYPFNPVDDQRVTVSLSLGQVFSF